MPCGALGIAITADMSKFREDLRAANRTLNEFGKQLEHVVKQNKKQLSEEPTPVKLTPVVNMKSKLTLVAAANGTDAKAWARKMGLKASQWKYVSSWAVILGRPKTDVNLVRLPGWEKRPDASMLGDLFKPFDSQEAA